MTTRNFALGTPLRQLVVRIGHGSVTVSARDDLAEATVELVPRDPESSITERIAVELRGDALAVVAPRQGGLADMIGGRRRDRDAVDVTITVPAGTPAKISTATADVRVGGRVGAADIATGLGEITLDAVDGDLRLRYGSASSRVGSVAGSVVVRSGAGDARFGEIAGGLQAGFGSGELDVEVVRGAVRSRVGSGNARLGAVYGDVDLAAGSGGVSIGLPAGISARLDVTSGSGRVESELPIEQAPAPSARPITVRARTGSGTVRLYRAGSAAPAA